MNILISNTSKEPLFTQIKRQIKEHIYSGTLTEGTVMPSIRTLAKELKVSVITTKRAYEDLENEGYLHSAVGRGTFVAGQEPHVQREWQLREFEQDLEAVIEQARQLGLKKTDLIERLDIFFEGDDES